jgi:hypothetical protein
MGVRSEERVTVREVVVSKEEQESSALITGVEKHYGLVDHGLII